VLTNRVHEFIEEKIFLTRVKPRPALEHPPQKFTFAEEKVCQPNNLQII